MANAEQFKAWVLYYEVKLQRFHYRPLTFHKKRIGGTKPFLFIGDHVRKTTSLLYRLVADQACQKAYTAQVKTGKGGNSGCSEKVE